MLSSTTLAKAAETLAWETSCFERAFSAISPTRDGRRPQAGVRDDMRVVRSILTDLTAVKVPSSLTIRPDLSFSPRPPLVNEMLWITVGRIGETSTRSKKSRSRRWLAESFVLWK